jgi:small-conductance mechanosensitive channel
MISLAIWLVVGGLCFAVDRMVPGWAELSEGRSLMQLCWMLAGILALSELLTLSTLWMLSRKNRPAAEGMMVSRIYRVAAGLAMAATFLYSLGKLDSIGTFFAAFGGLLLGWSLQAPVSGLAAWVLVSLKRPFRPGDRIQFPNLGLTGDVDHTGIMYTVLNQVGGSIGSEEAVNRHILVPNAMLFSQVVINYTVMQEAPYMLDEVVVRITFDSDWDAAERIMINAAEELTGQIIEATGVKPYIRSDLYDYGVLMRLRYQTRVKDRAEISYLITKRIFQDIQHTRSVDIAIPFVYSYRAGADKKEEDFPREKMAGQIQELEVDRVHSPQQGGDAREVKHLAESIAARGLLQPIVVAPAAHSDGYEIIAGHMRFEACKLLGWKTIPAVVKESRDTGGIGL